MLFFYEEAFTGSFRPKVSQGYQTLTYSLDGFTVTVKIVKEWTKRFVDFLSFFKFPY